MKLTHIVAGTALLLSGFTAGSLAIGLSASATSNSITFYACSNKTTGVLSATSTKAPTCAKTATLVSWNSVGPQGAKGDTGAPATSLSGIQFVRGYVIQASSDLFGADLGGANLTGANLTSANLAYADLSSTYLSGAYLSGANLRGADLGGANLTGADLTSATLDGANLTGANLTGANLTGATCPNHIVHGQSGANC